MTQSDTKVSANVVAIPVQEFMVRLSDTCLPKMPDCLDSILHARTTTGDRATIDNALQAHTVEMRRARGELIAQLKNELDTKGMRGRYVIHEQGSSYSGSELSLVVNSAEVLRIVQAAPFVTSMKQAQRVNRVMLNQLWECAHPMLEEVRLRFSSSQLDAVYDKVLRSSSPYTKDQRLALIEEANQARRVALRSIRKYLERSDLGRRFVIPSSQWDGASDSCVVVGVAHVRAALESSSKATIQHGFGERQQPHL